MDSSMIGPSGRKSFGHGWTQVVPWDHFLFHLHLSFSGFSWGTFVLWKPRPSEIVQHFEAPWRGHPSFSFAQKHCFFMLV
jgi:hypothetical protein